MKTKYYVGLGSDDFRETFLSPETPTRENTPHYLAVVGPFRTKRGAEYFRQYGTGNPHVQCVADAERLAAIHAAGKELRDRLSTGQNRFAYGL